MTVQYIAPIASDHLLDRNGIARRGEGRLSIERFVWKIRETLTSYTCKDLIKLPGNARLKSIIVAGTSGVLPSNLQFSLYDGDGVECKANYFTELDKAAAPFDAVLNDSVGLVMPSASTAGTAIDAPANAITPLSSIVTNKKELNIFEDSVGRVCEALKAVEGVSDDAIYKTTIQDLNKRVDFENYYYIGLNTVASLTKDFTMEFVITYTMPESN